MPSQYTPQKGELVKIGNYNEVSPIFRGRVGRVSLVRETDKKAQIAFEDKAGGQFLCSFAHFSPHR